MRRCSTAWLALALLILPHRGAPAVSDDPEPPPAIKVEAVKGAGKIEVKGGKQGPVVSVDWGAGRGTSAIVMTLGKEGPKQITFQFKGVSNVSNFALVGTGQGERFRLNLLRLQGKQTYHLDAAGQPLPDEKGARLTVVFEPKKEHVEVVARRHKGQTWPGGPIRVAWRSNPPVK